MDDGTVQIATVFGDEFTSFEAEAMPNSTVKLDFEVAADNEGKIFEVQRSVAGEEFNQIHTLRREDQPNGVFTYDDEEAPFNTPIRYRLLQNDANGNIHYSEIREVTLNAQGQGELIGLYPNVVSSDQPLQLDYLMRVAEGQVKVNIVDMTGRTVFNHRFDASGGKNTFWVMPRDLAPGSYVMQIDAEGKHDFARFQVVR